MDQNAREKEIRAAWDRLTHAGVVELAILRMFFTRDLVNWFRDAQRALSKGGIDVEIPARIMRTPTRDVQIPYLVTVTGDVFRLTEAPKLSNDGSLDVSGVNIASGQRPVPGEVGEGFEFAYSLDEVGAALRRIDNRKPNSLVGRLKRPHDWPAEDFKLSDSWAEMKTPTGSLFRLSAATDLDGKYDHSRWTLSSMRPQDGERTFRPVEKYRSLEDAVDKLHLRMAEITPGFRVEPPPFIKAHIEEGSASGIQAAYSYMQDAAIRARQSKEGSIAKYLDANPNERRAYKQALDYLIDLGQIKPGTLPPSAAK